MPAGTAPAPAAPHPAGAEPAQPGDGAEESGRTAATEGALRLGTYRPIWAAPEVEISPALHFAVARQQLELSPADAERLGITPGDAVEVAQLDDSGAAQNGEAGRRAGGRPEGTRVRAQAHVRAGVQEGTAFLAESLASDSANALTEPLVEVRKA